ncbi:MAG TPA: decaprenyl-phosphate phosphoribosyltransferase [Candidatus Nanoarchaeia archaeon]
MKIITKIYYLLISLRPRQWLKNLAVFTAIFFGGRFLEGDSFLKVSSVFLIFCALSSSMYLLNDVIDIKADRVHFSKKERPLAKGLLPKNLALVTSLVLSVLGLAWSYLISDLVLLTSVTFVVVQASYSLFLKQVIILDILAIALTFLLRVFAGSFAIEEPLSSWLILTIMMLAIFLAVGKRRSELTLMSYQQAVEHRHILSHYPVGFLDGITFMMGAASLLTYSLFSFNSGKSLSLISDYLPITLTNSRWLMLTIPLVIYGIFRYLYLVFEKKEGESPEKVLLSDFPLFLAVGLWVLAVFVIVYVFNA